MPQPDTQKHILLFNEFMEELRGRGFVIGVDHHLRVQKLLNSLGTDCSPSDMKYLLCPVFATDRKQQAEFYRIFERYFKPLERAVEKDDSTPSESRPHVSESVKISKIPYIVLGVLLFVLSAVLYLGSEKIGPIIFPPVTTTLPSVTTTTLAAATVTTTTLPEVTSTTLPAPLVSPEPPYDWKWKISRWFIMFGMLIVFFLTKLYDWKWKIFRWVAISGILIGFVLTESRRRAVLQKQGVKRPPFVWTIETPESDFLKTGQFYSAARLLRRRLKGEGTRLDVKKTVTESLKAGYPKLTYKAVTRPPEYLILIDLTSYRDHYAHFFAHIADALAKENIFVTRYFYRENPRVCFQDVGGEQFYLSDLKGKFRDCRLILVGTGDDLLDPFTGELGTWTRLFNAWTDRAILTPMRPMYWDVREVTLAEKFLVLPATLAGLAALPDYFEDPSKLSLRVWKEADARRGDHFPKPPNPPLKGGRGDVFSDSYEKTAPHGHPPAPPSRGDFRSAELRAYLGKEGFQWLCASAVYPELQWDLTLYLAQVCGIPESLFNEENLLRLIRLPWFREGNMPDDLRWKLMQELGETGLESVREKIAELFEKNLPHRDSFAYHAFRLNVAMQDFVFSSKRKERRKSRENLETVSESHIAQDYTLLRFLESAPKSGAALVLPERLRKVFYRNGIFVFGLKTGVRLLLTLCLVMSVFVMTLPKNSDVKQEIADISEPEVTTTITKTTITTTTLAQIYEPRITNSINMTFVYISPGEFMMGSPSNEPGRYEDEKQHKVKLTKGFYMQTTEVTQGQWKAVMGNNPSYFKNCGDDCPVEQVSWDDVQEFMRKLSQKEGKTYRLPTEAEWEYAARAGTTTPFAFGNCLSTDQANYDGNYPLSGCPKGKYREKTVPAASFAPNAFGLYDMHGNVWEWCQDRYGDYASGAVTDPTGPDSGSNRVNRGGSWYDLARYCRSAWRFRDSPAYRYDNLGFRPQVSIGEPGR